MPIGVIPTVATAKISLPASWITCIVTGDSRATGSSPAPGSCRIELGKLARIAGMPFEFAGSVSAPAVWSTSDLRPEPQEPFCEGYPGDTLGLLTVRWSPGGTSYNYVASRGVPTIVIVRCGTNDAYAGATGAAMWTSMQGLLAAISSVCPTSKILVESLPFLYSPAAPVGGLAAANAAIAAFNSLLSSNVANLGANFSYVDTVAGYSAADISPTDGVHDLPIGNAGCARRLFNAIVRLFPEAVLSSQIVPRRIRPRTAQASVKFVTTTTDGVIGAADNGARLPAGNFLGGCRLMFPTLPSAFAWIAYAAPTGLGYTHGWAIGIDGSATPKTFNYYDQSTGPGAVLAKQIPITPSTPFWLFWHGDHAKGVVSIWVAMPDNTDPLAPYLLFCVGEANNVAAWAQSDANPILSLGKNAAGNGFAGAIDTFFYSADSANVPSRANLRQTLEEIVLDGGTVPGITAQWLCNEGTGTSIASTVGGATGTLTGATATWYPTGVIVWPTDDRGGSGGLLAGFVGLGGGTQAQTGLIRVPKPSEQGVIAVIRKNNNTGDASFIGVDTSNVFTFGGTQVGGVYMRQPAGSNGGLIGDSWLIRESGTTTRVTWTVAAATIWNAASATSMDFQYNGASRFKYDSTGIGFFAAAPVAKPTVSGSRGGNAALASLLTSLASLGLITDSTTV